MNLITRLRNHYIYNGIYLNERVKAFFVEFSTIYNSIYNTYVIDYKNKLNELKDLLKVIGKEFDEKCIELSIKGVDITLSKRGNQEVITEGGTLKCEVGYDNSMKFSDFSFNTCAFDEEAIKDLDLYLEKAKNTNVPCVFLPKALEHEYKIYLEVLRKLVQDVEKALKESDDYKKEHIFATEATSKKYKALIDNYRFANESLMDYEFKNEITYETGMSFQKLTYEDLILIKEIHNLFEKFSNLDNELNSKEANMKQEEYNFFKRAGEEALEKMISSDSKWLDEIEYVKAQLFKMHLKKYLKEIDKPIVEYEENLGFSIDAVESFITLKKEEIDSLGYILLEKIDEGILNESKENGKVLSKKINGSDSV